MRIDLDEPIRGMTVWLLREYLEELGGASGPDGVVAGPGWSARLTQLEDHALGSLRIGQVRLELSGDEASLAELRRALTLKLMTRGGG
jgi:hypothetical protein